jgi:tripartite-type tricarboxylate transporter receptor subunit TctC
MKLPYDAEKDFAPISLAVTIPLMFVTHPSVPYKNLKDIAEESKKVNGGLPIAIASIGTLPHLLACR